MGDLEKIFLSRFTASRLLLLHNALQLTADALQLTASGAQALFTFFISIE
jgi:hypothetical protein